MKKLILILTTFILFGFTAFDPLPPNPGTLTAKGSLLSNSGTADVEVPACGDDQILVWDSTDLVDGVKCVDMPTSGITEYYFSSTSGIYSNTSDTAYTNPTADVSGVVVPSGAVVELRMIDSANDGFENFALNGACEMQWTRNGADIFDSGTREIPASEGHAPGILRIDSPSAGTYTYGLKARSKSTGEPICVILRQRLMVKVVPNANIN